MAAALRPAPAEVRSPRRPMSLYGKDREHLALAGSLTTAVAACLTSGDMLQTPTVEMLETRLALLCGRRFAVAVNSCTDALHIALRAAGVGAGDEVLVSDFTFVASASAIVRAGATPVLVDTDRQGLMDLDQAAAACTPRTKAVVVVDLLGAMHEPDAVEALARAHDLLVIEDAAQALGASHSGRPAGSVGDVSCLSFDPTKSLSAPGTGGMLLTDAPDIASTARLLRYHGRNPAGEYVTTGYNSQMSAITAAVLLLKLAYLDGWQQARTGIAYRYLEGLAGSVRTLHEPLVPSLVHAWQKFVVLSDRRDELAASLNSAGVPSKRLYTPPIHSHAAFTPYVHPGQRFPNAGRLAATALAIPIHPFLTEGQVEQVIRAVEGRPRALTTH